MKPGAVIFDMDGVIVNSEPLHEQAFYTVMEELGYADSHGIHFPNYIGRSDFELWHDFMERHKPAQSLDTLLELKRRRVIEVLQRVQPIFDGLLKLVQTLAPLVPLGLASGSERPVIEAVLNLEGLRRFFPVVVSAGEVAQGKPEPDIFLRAAELLSVSPEQCWVIEDSKPGVAAGLAAGMTVVAITNTHPAEELSAAHHVVRTYPEIQFLLLKASGSGGSVFPTSD